MEIVWDSRHGKILDELLSGLNTNRIKYFILRNYETLPDSNSSKDVDIIFEPGKKKLARKIVIDAFKNSNLEFYKEEQFGKVHSFWGCSVFGKLSIHIDLIEGYCAQGFSVYSFEELYEQVVPYRNFYVLNEFFSGLMLFIYKQFGYRKPKLKDEYKKEISLVFEKYSEEFYKEINRLTSQEYADKVCTYIKNQDYEDIIKCSDELNGFLKKYVWGKRPFATLGATTSYTVQRLDRMLFRYRKYSNNFAVLAPDGTGKTTFLDEVIDKLNFYRVCRMEDNHISVYHFRPNFFPNLGVVGERAGIKKQDTDFTNPHRNKPAGKVSSLVRMTYYICDYIVGWQIRVRQDTRRNKWSIFDRYSYDLIVDPLRTRLSLPEGVRKSLVALTPKPSVIFCLLTEPEIIYKRKQELELEEISRQLKVYKEVAESDKKRFYILDASKTPDALSDEAILILFSRYMKKL
ncbi:hypothetical protein DXB59_14975 [Ruminococcus sp. OM05-10BH]|nr:hypothetical protein DXB59_14975 [Ruminococcus sp. OM05-10BH]